MKALGPATWLRRPLLPSAMAKKPDTSARIADNKKAAFDYFFEERFEAGLVLEGWEVKSLREGKVHRQLSARAGKSSAAADNNAPRA